MKQNEKINKKLIDLLLKKANGFHYEEELFEYEREKKKNENLSFFDICDRGESNIVDDGVIIKSANEKDRLKSSENLVLVKKKVTTHYIPPDMVAIKILLEIFGKEDVNEIEKMSDDELIKLKEKIIEEIKNEDNI